MGKKWPNAVYRDDHGTYWARVNGKRQTLNTAKAHWSLMRALELDADRGNDAPVPGDQEIIMLRGVPGSGKTTWAKAYINEHRWVKRVCKDDLRAMLQDGYRPEWEGLIRELRDALIRALLDRGLGVIVDDTNVHPRDYRDLRAHTRHYNRATRQVVRIPFRVMEFDTPIDVCVARDAARVHPVGEARIRELYARYLRTKQPISDDLVDVMNDILEG